MVNKKGWAEVLEVFFSIILLASVMTIVLNSHPIEKQSQSKATYEIEHSVLEKIQLNNSLRNKVIAEDNNSVFYSINETIPSYLECALNICEVGEGCLIDIEKETYVSSVIIFNNETEYSPKKLNLICWEK